MSNCFSIPQEPFPLHSYPKYLAWSLLHFQWWGEASSQIWGEVLQLGSIININRNGKDAQCEKVIPAIAHLAFHHSEHLLQRVQLHRSASFHVHTVNLQHSWIQVSEKTTHEQHIIYIFFSVCSMIVPLCLGSSPWGTSRHLWQCHHSRSPWQKYQHVQVCPPIFLDQLSRNVSAKLVSNWTQEKHHPQDSASKKWDSWGKLRQCFGHIAVLFLDKLVVWTRLVANRDQYRTQTLSLVKEQETGVPWH